MKDFKDDGYIDTVYEIVKQYIKKSKIDAISRYDIHILIGVTGVQALKEHDLLKEENLLGTKYLCFGYSLINKPSQWHKPTPDELEDLFKRGDN